ncbi:MULTISPECIES: DUF86 domain-containing protein [Bacillus]|uniref:DUF86 domain-containing protein n=1 Tax=Bacillus glycinifermentans TaxID=1664069 RepID=A0A0T6BRJ1_9BACI|nr:MULTISPECIES: DUF86 domain-containing protein [Bacillus]ATH93023.1 DUF86 domain-containing protein [Bacillus glycinifermentans]KKB72936.1 hypothetical protein TH62_14985 [Bacillus sp. TH008]KRT94267.1 hypothetical protein AB447_202975 [Bacillus glycinifermentans]MBU8785374.1 DUF86 domain-containing protein [Bacillus glycinifermentans]MDU0072976.1 DUF86 domain-containing protein [Bacillus sp. IG6]
MYFVDRNKIENTLNFFEEQLRLFHKQTEWASDIEKKALERIGHTLIESILDVGNDMIDGFIMRDPGSYDDIMDILADEKVVSQTEGEDLKQLIACRKALVQDYLNVSHGELENLLKTHAEALEAFPVRIRDYLNNELGPVSAFKPH